MLALVASFLLPPRPAEASYVVWSGTLTAQGTAGGFGCSGGTGCGNALSDNSLNIDTIKLGGSGVGAGNLAFSLNRNITQAEKQNWALEVKRSYGRIQTLKFADAIWWTAAGGDTIRWGAVGFAWTAQQQVSLRVVDTTEVDDRVNPNLDQLPVDTDRDPLPANRRIPEGSPPSDAFCYLANGNSKTEFIRYPDGRIAETTAASPAIRRLFACD